MHENVCVLKGGHVEGMGKGRHRWADIDFKGHEVWEEYQNGQEFAKKQDTTNQKMTRLLKEWPTECVVLKNWIRYLLLENIEKI